jgi:hypothetical protein
MEVSKTCSTAMNNSLKGNVMGIMPAAELDSAVNYL